jgi:hypothetical protein
MAVLTRKLTEAHLRCAVLLLAVLTVTHAIVHFNL